MKHIGLLVFLAAAVAGCSDATSTPVLDNHNTPPTRVLDGKYGGADIGLDVTASGTRLSLDCAVGEITDSIPLDQAGRFDVAGTWTGEGNAPNADHTTHAVHYTGVATRDTVHIIIVGVNAWPSDTLVAARGAPAVVAGC